MLKRFIGLFVFSITLFWLVGCEGLNNAASPQAPSPVASAASVPKAGTAREEDTRTVIVYARGLDETDATQKVLEAYNQQSSRVYVKYQELPYAQEEQYNQVSLALASGQSYDVVDIDLIFNAEFAAKGYSLNLEPYLTRDGIDWEDYLPAAVEAVHYDGKPYAMPRSISPGMLYYRTDIIDSPPEDWDALIRLSQMLQGRNNTKYGYVFSGRMSDSLVVEALEIIYSYGGRLLDVKGNLAVNVTETVTALEKFREIYQSDFVASGLQWMSDNDACVSFLEGESVFMRNLPYAWALGNHSSSQVQGKFAIAALPKGDEGSVSLLNGYVSMIPSQSPYPEEAWDFVRYLTGVEGQTISAVNGGRIPTLLSVFDNGAVLEKNPHFGSHNFRSVIANSSPRPITPHYARLMEILRSSIYDFLQGDQSAEEMLRNFADQMAFVNAGS